MESSERLIELYRMGFIICLCLAAVFLLLSIFFFFKFRIRDVFDFLSGRAEKKSVKQMEEKNAKTGKLRDDYYAEPLSSELYKTPSGKVVPTMYPQTEPMNTGTEPTQETQTKMSQTPTQPSSNGSEETTLLGSGQEETTLLGNGETGTEETTLLGNQNRNKEEQEIPGYNGETALLTPEMEKAIHKQQEEKKQEEKEKEAGTKEQVEVSPAKEKVKINKRPVTISDNHPLWTKHPNECSDEDYKEFYRKVFNDYREPLFWIHLNMDYPFNLKGILYFPRINTEYDSIEGTIKLYNNQVFIADNIKEVIPEYLMLLKGVIDCPDLPLNVSRSALQNDGFVKKISEYISKKFADKLSGMCKTDRENYEKYWDDINPFIKYGCIKDEKFSKKMMDYILFKNIDGKYLTLEDCINENKKEEAPAENTEEKAETTENTENTENADEKKEPEKTTVYYVTDEVQQSQYINMFRSQGMDAVILKHNIDSAFITHAERYNEHVTFQRIDADLTNDMKDESGEDLTDATNTLTDLFRKVLDKKDLTVKVENLKDENVSSMVTLSEESRRMQDMMKMYGMTGMDPSMFGGQETLILNAKHPLVQYILKNGENDNTSLFCEQLYDLAMISHKPLSPDEMTKFVSRSNQIMMLLAK